MPRLAAEGLTAERLARLAWRAAGSKLRFMRHYKTRDQIGPRPLAGRGPVVIDAEEFYGLPEELQLRLLERVIDGPETKDRSNSASLRCFARRCWISRDRCSIGGIHAGFAAPWPVRS